MQIEYIEQDSKMPISSVYLYIKILKNRVLLKFFAKPYRLKGV